HVVGVDAVGPDADGLAAPPPVMLQQRSDDVLPRLLLVTRSDRVLQVEKDVIGPTIERLAEHPGLRAGDGEFAALKPLARGLVAGMTHRPAPAVAFSFAGAATGCASGARGGRSRLASGAAVRCQ